MFSPIKTNKNEVVKMAQEAVTEQPKDSKDEQVMKRIIKSSVFTDLFGDYKYLIELYRALHPEDTTTTEKDIVDVTINNVLTDNQYNDLDFRIGNTLLVLVEHQSTWSVNIIIRILMYLMQTYNEYFKVHNIDLYSSTKAEVPKPELYVIYTGDRKSRPEYISLKDEFFSGQEVAVDAKVKVIYDGEPGDIINQYVVFTQVCNEQVKLYGRTQKAIEETIRICKDKNVLKEYLESREKEVINIMVALYDEQEVMDRYVASEKREISIQTTVEDCQFFGQSLTDAIECVASRFNLTPTVAEQKVKRYWL